MTVPTAPPALLIDVFCGAGGATRGILNTGAYVIAGVDSDFGCKRTYVLNNRNHALDQAYPAFLALSMYPKTPAHPEGQLDTVIYVLQKLTAHARGMSPGTPLTLWMSPPCQTFSRLNRSTRHDDRNMLMHHTMPLIQALEPEIIICENVPQAATGANRDSWDSFWRNVTRSGYQQNQQVLNAADYGVPQNRVRIISFATRIPPFHPARRAAEATRAIAGSHFDQEQTYPSDVRAFPHHQGT